MRRLLLVSLFLFLGACQRPSPVDDTRGDVRHDPPLAAMPTPPADAGSTEPPVHAPAQIARAPVQACPATLPADRAKTLPGERSPALAAPETLVSPPTKPEAKPSATDESITSAEFVEPQRQATTVSSLPEKIDQAIRLRKGDYTLRQPIEITAEGSLELMPGTRLSFYECGIVSHGAIYARGRPGEEIVWQGPEGWDNVTLLGAQANGIFVHCHFSGGMGAEMDGVGHRHQLVPAKNEVTVGGALLYGQDSRGSVQNCRFVNNIARGALALVGAKDVQVEHNEFAQNGDDALLLRDCSPLVKHNRIIDNRKNGIVCEGSCQARVESNRIENNGNTGIVVQDTAAPQLIDNLVRSNNCGLFFSMQSAGKVSNNTVCEQQLMGVTIVHTAAPLLENNLLSGNDNLAIVCRDKSSPLLRGNQCRNHKIAAIAVLDEAAPAIEGNTLQDSPYGLVIDYTAQPRVGVNHTHGCREEIQKKAAQKE